MGRTACVDRPSWNVTNRAPPAVDILETGSNALLIAIGFIEPARSITHAAAGVYRRARGRGGMAAVAGAQQRAMPVVGVLDGGGSFVQFESAFREGLSGGGYIEGRNITIESRSANGEYDRLPTLAAELVRRQVAVIATATPVAALAAKAATTTIPIVFFLGSDPVRDGLVGSLNRPSGNVTGITWFANVLTSKRLELFHELLPKATDIAVLVNPNNANAGFELTEAETAAPWLGVRLNVVRARTEQEIDTAFASLVQQRAIALFLIGDAFFGSRAQQIVALATQHAIATSSAQHEDTKIGGLMSYAASRMNSARQFGNYVAHILRGRKPADLPVMQPTKFEFLINLKTARALRIEVPPMLLARADEVIE
jgi:putative tryptophan/tyrosine transport system substrate-binding protein